MVGSAHPLGWRGLVCLCAVGLGGCLVDGGQPATGADARAESADVGGVVADRGGSDWPVDDAGPQHDFAVGEDGAAPLDAQPGRDATGPLQDAAEEDSAAQDLAVDAVEPEDPRPRLVDVRAFRHAWIEERPEIRLQIQGVDPDGDATEILVRPLRDGAVFEVRESYVPLEPPPAGPEFTASATLRMDADAVRVWLADARRTLSEAVDVVVEQPPARAVGDACDPAGVVDVCVDGARCLDASCVAWRPPLLADAEVWFEPRSSVLVVRVVGQQFDGRVRRVLVEHFAEQDEAGVPGQVALDIQDPEFDRVQQISVQRQPQRAVVWLRDGLGLESERRAVQVLPLQRGEVGDACQGSGWFDRCQAPLLCTGEPATCTPAEAPVLAAVEAALEETRQGTHVEVHARPAGGPLTEVYYTLIHPDGTAEPERWMSGRERVPGIWVGGTRRIEAPFARIRLRPEGVDGLPGEPVEVPIGAGPLLLPDECEPEQGCPDGLRCLRRNSDRWMRCRDAATPQIVEADGLLAVGGTAVRVSVQTNAPFEDLDRVAGTLLDDAGAAIGEFAVRGELVGEAPAAVDEIAWLRPPAPGAVAVELTAIDDFGQVSAPVTVPLRRTGPVEIGEPCDPNGMWSACAEVCATVEVGEARCLPSEPCPAEFGAVDLAPGPEDGPIVVDGNLLDAPPGRLAHVFTFDAPVDATYGFSVDVGPGVDPQLMLRSRCFDPDPDYTFERALDRGPEDWGADIWRRMAAGEQWYLFVTAERGDMAGPYTLRIQWSP